MYELEVHCHGCLRADRHTGRQKERMFRVFISDKVNVLGRHAAGKAAANKGLQSRTRAKYQPRNWNASNVLKYQWLAIRPFACVYRSRFNL